MRLHTLHDPNDEAAVVGYYAHGYHAPAAMLAAIRRDPRHWADDGDPTEDDVDTAYLRVDAGGNIRLSDMPRAGYKYVTLARCPDA